MILVIVTTPDTRYLYLNWRFRKAVRDMCIAVSGKYSYLKTVGSFLYVCFVIGAPKVSKTAILRTEKSEETTV
jgi:hypothetical protein